MTFRYLLAAAVVFTRLDGHCRPGRISDRDPTMAYTERVAAVASNIVDVALNIQCEGFAWTNALAVTNVDAEAREALTRSVYGQIGQRVMERRTGRRSREEVVEWLIRRGVYWPFFDPYSDFTEDDFGDGARQVLAERLQRSPCRRTMLLTAMAASPRGETLIREFSKDRMEIRVDEDGRTSLTTESELVWTAVLVGARRGDTQSMDRVLATLDRLDSRERARRLCDLVYIGNRRATERLIAALFSNTEMTDSHGGPMLMAWRVKDYLRKLIDGYPTWVRVEDARRWIQEHPDWQLKHRPNWLADPRQQ
jgi:hypothetical protein